MLNNIAPKYIIEMSEIINHKSILFFDMDGTLVDTDYANFLSYKKAVKTVKKSDFNMVYDPTRRFNRELLKQVIPHLTEVEMSMIISEKENCSHDFLSKTQLNYEIAKILCKYYKNNRTVLVTNGRKNRALATLNYHGLADKFQHLFFLQFDEKGREINKFHNAILSLRISPNDVIVFENEEREIEKAKQAGIQMIINPIILQKNESIYN